MSYIKRGFEVELQRWKMRQFMLKTSTLIVDGQEVNAFPLWLPKATGTQPVEGPLTVLHENAAHGSLEGKIALATFPFNLGQVSRRDGELVLKAAIAGALALVAVVVVVFYESADSRASYKFIGLNAMQESQAEWPVTIVTVKAKDYKLLQESADSGAEVQVVSTGSY
jgi:hypothetical protein